MADIVAAFFLDGLCTITFTTDDVTGAITRVSWRNGGGPATVTISQTGKQDITRAIAAGEVGAINVNKNLAYRLGNTAADAGVAIAWAAS